MTEPENSDRSEPDSRGGDHVQRVESFARALSKVDLTLLAVRDELYGGDWEEVEHDLRARLSGRPYIFKLASHIEEDLERIGELREFEEREGIDLREVASALGLEPTGGAR